jgi:hypothetical protein
MVIFRGLRFAQQGTAHKGEDIHQRLVPYGHTCTSLRPSHRYNPGTAAISTTKKIKVCIFFSDWYNIREGKQERFEIAGNLSG